MTNGEVSGTPVPPSTASKRETTTLDFVTVVVRHRQVVLGLPLGTMLLTVGLSFFTPRTFTATTTFVPEAPSGSRLPPGLAGLAGVAGQLGLSLGPDATRSPRFYAGVLTSRELMERVVQARYVDPRRSGQPRDSARLLEILEVRGRDSANTLFNAVRALRKRVSAQVDNQTGMLRLSVGSRYPDLAAAVANRFVVYLNDFNTQTRQSQARERRKFVEQRIADAELELRTAEEALRAFYERNRSWQQAPQLAFEEGRRRRQVDIRQEVYLTLSREYETARVEEVNDTPVITVIDPAVTPQKPSGPRRAALAVLSLLIGGVGGFVLAFAWEYLHSLRLRDPDRYRNLTALFRRSHPGLGGVPGARIGERRG